MPSEVNVYNYSVTEHNYNDEMSFWLLRPIFEVIHVGLEGYTPR